MSGRVDFQMYYFRQAEKPILNIGSERDPFDFGRHAVHVDMDNWGHLIPNFIQADAQSLPFKDYSFHTVIAGDILEHVPDYHNAILEWARVSRKFLVLTVFEEWRVGPTTGQFIEETQAREDAMYAPTELKNHKDYIEKELGLVYHGVDNIAHPHLYHINQFSDTDIMMLVGTVTSEGFRCLEYIKDPELVADGHQAYNWLLAFERV